MLTSDMLHVYMSNTMIKPEYALNTPNMLRFGYHPWKHLDFRDRFVQNATKKTRKQIIIINDIPELKEGWGLRVIFIFIFIFYLFFFQIQQPNRNKKRRFLSLTRYILRVYYRFPLPFVSCSKSLILLIGFQIRPNPPAHLRSGILWLK